MTKTEAAVRMASRASRAYRVARENRDRTIRDLHAGGATVQALASATGLSVPRIYQILNSK